MSNAEPTNPRPDKEIFFEALDSATPDERAALLDGACGSDPVQRRRVEELLALHFKQNPFMQEPAAEGSPAVLSTAPLTEVPGTQIGRYKLLEKLGEGGFGAVYVAEQKEPVKRRVALKIIKLGMDTRQVVARFEAERQALALMDHPNIAKVLDGGATDTGRLYFVMELVRGVPITRYCDENNLTTVERLKLFILVCQAIQHAHQKGIIHRDIKPSNIMVTLHDGVPIPKVIDFGIAKAIEGELTDKTVYTQFQQFIGTPAYMSPEQAQMSALDVDTRTDIYAVGVLLYELLVGKTPFDAKELLESGLDEMRRTIREKEPLKPSTRLTQTLVAADVRRLKSPSSDTPGSEEEVRASSRRLLRIKETITLLKGDLDWIVMKCLEKERRRRYATANDLAADLRRHLNSEPVLARPQSPLYRFRKMMRRNKGLFIAAATVLATLLAGLTVSTYLFFLEKGAHERARVAEQEQTRLRLEAESARTSEASLRHRAEQGEQQARHELWHSYLAQARAARFSGQPGRRFDSLDVLAKAAAMRFAPELRDEAIACLALPDLRLKRRLDAARGVFDRALQRYAVAATNLGDISIRRVTDDQEILLLPSVPGTVLGIDQFSHDGKWLPVSCLDHWLRVWDLERGVVALTIPCAGRHPGLDFHPDDQSLAVAAGHAEISIYQLATGQKVNSFPSPFVPMYVRYDPSGRKLAISSWSDPRLSILDASSGTALMTLTNEETLGVAAWHPRDSSLAVVGKRNLLFVWDTATGQRLHTLKGHQSTPDSVAFNHDGDILISSGWDGARLWHARAGEHLMRGQNTLGGFGSFAGDDRTYGYSGYHLKPSLELLSFASGREARRWHAKEEDTEHKVITFSSDGRWLAFGAGDFVKLFDARTGDLLARLPTGPPVGAHFQKSGGGLLVSGERGLFLWPIRAADGAGEISIGPPEGVGSPEGWQQASLSENGQVFAAFHGDHVRTFETEGMQQMARTRRCGDQDQFRYLSLSPDGRRLATGGWLDAVVKIWDSRTGALVKELLDPEWSPDGSPKPMFEPNGRSLIIACGLSYSLWETNSWTPVLRVARSDMNMIAISHFSGLMAMRNGQTSIQLLDIASGEVLATLQSPLTEFVLDFTFSPDDTQLAVTHLLTRELLVWDLRLVREQLAKMGLDWNRPPYPPAAFTTSAKAVPWRILTNPVSTALPSP